MARIPYKNSTPKQLEQRQKNLKGMWKKGVNPPGSGIKSAKEVIDGEEVRKLACLGATRIEIANFYGVSRETIRRHFSDEVIKGHEDMKLNLRRAQYKNAIERGSNTMLIWLGKQMLGQTEKQEVDHNHVMVDLLKEVGYVDDPKNVNGYSGSDSLIEEGSEQGKTLA